MNNRNLKKDADVYFQPSAWMDKELTLRWVKGALIPSLKSGDKQQVLFAVNADFTPSKNFVTYADRKLTQLFICCQLVIQKK